MKIQNLIRSVVLVILLGVCTTNTASAEITGGGTDTTYQWTQTASGTSMNYPTLPKSVTTDTSGNIYITGRFFDTVDFDPTEGTDIHTSNGEFDMFMTKYDVSGVYQWTKTVGGLLSEEGRGITTDVSGNVYVVGFFYGTADFDPETTTDNHTSGGQADIFLTKYNSLGAYQWTKTVGGLYTEEPFSVVVDSLNNIYITGSFQNTVDFDPSSDIDSHTSLAGNDFFLSKYTSTGVYQWTKANVDTRSISIDSSDNIYTVGRQSLTKYDASGTFQWQKTITALYYVVTHVTTDSSDNIYIVGTFSDLVDFDPDESWDVRISDTYGGRRNDFFISKYTPSGAYQWTRVFSDRPLGSIGAVTTDNLDNIYITGYFGGTVGGLTTYTVYDAFLIKYDALGTHAWTKTIGGTYVDQAWSIVTDLFENIYVVGNFYGTVDFNPGTETDEHVSNGLGDMFLTKFSNDNPVTNTPPSIINNDQIINENTSLTLPITATDPDSNTVTLSAENLPEGATFDTETGIFSWTPSYDQAGEYMITFIATDDGTPSLSATGTVMITVLDTNRAPALAQVGDRVAAEGSSLVFTLSATDPDSDALSYSAANLPDGAVFEPSTGTFSWTPSYDQAGNYSNIEFAVMDNGSPMELDVELITITVGDVNRAPVFSGVGPQEVLEDQQLMFTVSATDPDSDAILLSASGIPLGAVFDPTTGIFSWTPTNAQSGTYVVQFNAMDNETPSATSSLDVSITVGDVPTPQEQINIIIETVVDGDFPTNVENSYLANLKKVPKFIEQGKLEPAIEQLLAFIVKVQEDMTTGIIDPTIGNELLEIANVLLNDLQ